MTWQKSCPCVPLARQQVHKANYTTMPLREHVKRMTNYAHEYSCYKLEKDVVGLEAKMCSAGMAQRV